MRVGRVKIVVSSHIPAEETWINVRESNSVVDCLATPKTFFRGKLYSKSVLPDTKFTSLQSEMVVFFTVYWLVLKKTNFGLLKTMLIDFSFCRS